MEGVADATRFQNNKTTKTKERHKMNKTTRTTFIKSIVAACAIACAGFAQQAEAAAIYASINNANYVQVRRSSVSGATQYRLYRNTVNNRSTAKLVWTGTAGTVNDWTAALGYKYYYWLAYKKNGKWYVFTTPDWGARKMTLVLARQNTGSKLYFKPTVNGSWVKKPWTVTWTKNICSWSWYTTNPYIGYFKGKKKGTCKWTLKFGSTYTVSTSGTIKVN